MSDLWMELDTKKLFLSLLHNSRLTMRGLPGYDKPRRNHLHPVPMAHPYLPSVFYPREQSSSLCYTQRGKPVFSFLRRSHFASQKISHELQSITDAQDRNPHLENLSGGKRSLFTINTLRTSREDQSSGIFSFDS